MLPRRSRDRNAPGESLKRPVLSSCHAVFAGEPDMAYDLLITNGPSSTAPARPRFKADVAVQGGRIAAIGKIDGSAATVIDAAGKIVCPGFVDPHTHYDAQITWDRLLSSSAEHGVTTVVMGNCGVGIAPCRPAEREWLADDLVTVEGIDKEVLVEGIKWEWETFPGIPRRGGAARLRRSTSRFSRRSRRCAPTCSARRRTSAPRRRRKRKTIAALLGEAMRGRRVGLHHHREPAAHRPRRQAARPRASRAARSWPRTAACSRSCERGVIELALTKRYATLAEDEEELLEVPARRERSSRHVAVAHQPGREARRRARDPRPRRAAHPPRRASRRS